MNVISCRTEEGVSCNALIDQMFVDFDSRRWFSVFDGFYMLDEFRAVNDQTEIAVWMRT